MGLLLGEDVNDPFKHVIFHGFYKRLAPGEKKTEMSYYVTCDLVICAVLLGHPAHILQGELL